MNGVVGNRDDLFLDLNIVDLIVEVEGDVLSLGSLDGLHSHVDIAVNDLQVAGLDELIALGESHIAGVDVNGVVGNRDDLFLDLDVVDLIKEVEGDVLGRGILDFLPNCRINHIGGHGFRYFGRPTGKGIAGALQVAGENGGRSTGQNTCGDLILKDDLAVHAVGISDGKFLISVIRSSVSVLIRSPDSVQSDIVCNGQCAGYKLHICCNFFGLNQIGLSFAPAEESSAVLFEIAAFQDSNLCILTIGVVVCYNTFAVIRIASDLITRNANNSAVYIYRTGCAIGFCIGQGCALIG